jgi:DNA-binding transcriptional MerR regulator
MIPTYSIGELSREFSVTTRTIRFYEDEGLLAPGRHGRNRVYASRDRTRLRLILRGKRLGFALSEIAELLDLYDDPGGETSQLQIFLRKISEHRETLKTQRAEIDAILGEMNSLERRCHRILRGATQ